MPGLGLSMGITLMMLSIVVLLPIGALLLKGAHYGVAGIWDTVNRERVWSALFLSFRLSLFAALFNLVFGVLLAWVLVRYRFPGRRILDAAVDLPFALPTAVAGISLTALYAPNGASGNWPPTSAGRSPTRNGVSSSPWCSWACPSSPAPCNR